MNIDDNKNLLLSLFVTIVVGLLLLQAGFFQRGQFLIDDGVQKFWGHTADYSDILIVDIDEPSMQALQSQLGSWPYNRYIFSSLSKYLKQAGADQIVFDILFTDQRQGDEIFASQLKEYKNMHLAAILLHDYVIDNKKQSELLKSKYWRVDNPPDLKNKGALFPNDALLEQANIGLISVIPAVDGVVRDIPLIYNIDRHYLPSMALSVVSRAGGDRLAFDWDENMAVSGGYTWPVTDKGAVTLKYSKNLRNLPIVPFYKVLLSVFGDTENGLPHETFANKTIFIGSTATVLGDYTYVPNEGRIYGLGLLAHIYHSLKHGHVLNSQNTLADFLVSLPWLLILVGIILVKGIKPVALYAGVIVVAILSAVMVVVLYRIFSIQAWYLFPAFLAFLFVVITTLIKTITLQLEKTRIHMEHVAAEEARVLREKYLVYHDLLTELPNRELFLERAISLISEAGESGSIAVLLIDLDRFKTINDALGHEVGDKLLIELSKRLKQVVQQSGVLARLGGDEFAVLLETSEDDQMSSGFALRLLRMIAQPFQIDDHTLHVTASIGISCFSTDGDDVNELLKNSEIAMYRAKELGSNNYQYYSEDINVSDLQRLTLENDLRVALENNEFILFYQPKVSIDTGKIVGVEALIRWQHSTLGLIQPMEFISLLEETNLIIEVGDWVISTACQQLHQCHMLGLPELTMAINISGRQFNADSFTANLNQQARQYDIQPEYIELEITENILMENYQSTIDCLNELYKSGFYISIDDFGTGYSSLSYLRQFRINVLKIDKSFIDDVSDNPDSAAIAAAIIAMAHSLRMSTVAEGIETAQQLDFLKRHQCEIGQGFLFSKPLPADEITQILKAGLPLISDEEKLTA